MAGDPATPTLRLLHGMRAPFVRIDWRCFRIELRLDDDERRLAAWEAGKP